MDGQQRLGDITKHVNQVGKFLADLEERGRQQARAWRMRGATMESQHTNAGSVSLQDDHELCHSQAVHFGPSDAINKQLQQKNRSCLRIN